MNTQYKDDYEDEQFFEKLSEDIKKLREDLVEQSTTEELINNLIPKKLWTKQIKKQNNLS